MRTWAFLLLFGVTPATWAEEVMNPPVEAPPLPPPGLEEKVSQSSWVPVAGYNPTYKFFFGGGYFYKSPAWDFGIHGVLTFDKVYQIMTHSAHVLAPRWQYRTDLEYSKGFEPFYGEGGQTKVADRIRIFGDKTLLKPSLTYAANPFWDVGFFLDIRLRTETRVEDGPNYRRYPEESTLGFGLSQQLDKRDDSNNPSGGFIFTTRFTLVPTALTTVKGKNSFSQLEADIAIYQETVMGAIAAVKLYAGATFGDPTYSFKYRLGGTDNLRGYQDNRFRGKKYYLQQTELRMPFWKFLDVVPFIGFGDATDTEFTQAKMAYGIGARIGLPPDYINKIRIDFGIGRDESGIFVDFGQTF